MRATILAALAAAALAASACGNGEPVSRTLGARCDLSSECDERCLTGGDYPGGMCTVSCDGTSGCPAGSVCTADQGGVCLYTCGVDGDCAFLGAGWKCAQVDGHPSGKVMACRGG